MRDSPFSNIDLIKKLGFLPGNSVYIQNAPIWYKNYLISFGLILTEEKPTDWSHIFFDDKKQLNDYCEKVDFKQISKALWVSWPKKASGIKTDLTEQSLRDAILPLGWVDIKVAAINQIWSGLKFTRRQNN